jgi:hypothetical protein
MTSLKQIAHMLHSLADAYVPPVVLAWGARSGAAAREALARLTHSLPIMTRDQIDFMTSSPEPTTDHAPRSLLRGAVRKFNSPNLPSPVQRSIHPGWSAPGGGSAP